MLTDKQVKAAKAADKPYKLADSRGLYLYVTPTGFKSRRWKYRIDGKEKRLTFGPYPELSIAEARELRDAALKMKRHGTDPSRAKLEAKKEQLEASLATFERAATTWHDRRKTLLTSRHGANLLRFLQAEAFPKLGARPIKSITSPMVLDVLLAVEKRSADRAHRLRGHISDIYVFAIAAGLADSDPAASLRKALKPIQGAHYPALRTIKEARELLLAAEATPAHPLTRLASRLLALTAVRSGTLREAESHEFSLEDEEPTWRIPARKMKLDQVQRWQEAFDFIVPLAPSAVEIVRLAMELTAGGPYLFPNSRDPHKPMSDNSISVMYRRLPGFASRHVPHGWRSTFSTIMNERAQELERPGDREVLDLMLAHKPRGVEGIYNRAAYMKRRREIAHEWAELLLGPLPELKLEALPPPSSLLPGARR